MALFSKLLLKPRPVNTQLISEKQALRLLRVLLLGGAALAVGIAGLTIVLVQMTR